MTKYRINITETMSRTIETEADSDKIAMEKVKLMYRDCDIVLDASDYVGTEFSVISEKRGECLKFSKINS